MDKVDLKREVGAYRASRRFAEVDIPPLMVLAVDGEGDPDTAPAYRDAVSAIFATAYALKFAEKRAGRDFVVMPLEAQWWADDLAAFTDRRDKARWRWTLLNAVPDTVTVDAFERAREAAAAETGPTTARLRLERFAEGRCMQVLHVGPYEDEGPVLARLHDEVVPAAGLRPRGRHHEVYLNDARRTDPSRLRTILRQPVEPDSL